MTDNHLYVLSVDNQQENMRTISKYVQQYQTSVTIGLVWYYGQLAVLNAAERTNSSNNTETFVVIDFFTITNLTLLLIRDFQVT